MLENSSVFSLFQLKGKTALVTGASSGIGSIIALSLARAGANIAAWGRSPKGLKRTLEMIEEQCRMPGMTEVEARSFSVELADHEEMEDACRNLEAAGVHVDILVNAAGINPRLAVEKMTKEAWDQTIAVNLTAPYYLAKYFAPLMIRRKQWGRIVNIGSLQSIRAFPDSTAYGASKGGVAQLTRALAETYSKHGVLVNAVAPGFFNTGLTSVLFEDDELVESLAQRTMIGRNGEPEDFFGISVFLCSDACSYITGQMIFLDGGFSAK